MQDSERAQLAQVSEPRCRSISNQCMLHFIIMSVIGNDRSSDQLFHDFIGSAVDRLDTRVDVGSGDWIFPHITVATMQLNALICDSVLQVTYPEKCANVVQSS